VAGIFFGHLKNPTVEPPVSRKELYKPFSSPRAIGICWEVNAGRWMAGNCG